MENNLIFVLALVLVRFIPARTKGFFFTSCRNAETKNDVFTLAKNLILSFSFPATIQYKGNIYSVTNDIKKRAIFNLFACGECARQIALAETWKEYMIAYAEFKATTYNKLTDYGAFGDLVETVCHLLVNKKVWRTKIKTLHVSAIGKTDLRYNGKKIEVGTNGKSWLESTEEDAMSGKFDGVLYGVFSEEEKESICKEFSEGKVEKAISDIAKMLYYFENKNDFPIFVNSISRSPSLVWKKGGYFQTVYNPSKHVAFIRAIENSNFPTLYDIIGKNDFIE